MASWSVVRERPGHPNQTLWMGRLKHMAERIYERENREPGTVVKLFIHDGHGPRLLRKSDDVVIDTCSRCQQPIDGDLVPAVDAFTGGKVCADCHRVERHVRRSA